MEKAAAASRLEHRHSLTAANKSSANTGPTGLTSAAQFGFRSRPTTSRVLPLGAGWALGQRQGLILVHFSAQLEHCLSQENSLHTQNTP